MASRASSQNRSRANGEESEQGTTLITRAPKEPRPRIEITPTVAEYRQLCRDLAKLREQGAPSNTTAILAAVSHAAAGASVRDRSVKEPPKRLPRAKARR
jgi:hypothetical protein